MKILIITTTGIMDRKIGEYINSKELPEAEYTLVQERFGEEPLIRTYVDHYIPIFDIGDIDEVKQVAKQCEKYGPYDYIVQTDEYSVILAEKIKFLLNQTELSIKNILRFRDKELMKKHIHNVKTPQCYSLEELEKDVSYFPVIIKPRSYAASNGVYKVDTYEQLVNIITQNKLEFIEDKSVHDYLEYEEAEENDIELEEYIEGNTYHIDGIVFNQKILFCAANQYINTCLEFSKGIPMGSIFINDETEQQEWREFAEKIHNDIQLPNGVFHLEAFKNDKGERVFLELAIRPGGGLIPEVTRMAHGVDLLLAHIQCQLDIEPNIHMSNKSEAGFLLISNMILPYSKNILKKIIIPDRPLTTLINVKLPYIGDVLEKHNNYDNLIGEFIFQGYSREQIEEDMKCLMENYVVEVEEFV